jgi:DNA-binding beta-propeller fold protein YncE
MGFDGHHMVAPNSNSADSTLYEFTGFNTGKVLAKQPAGAVSIASGMMPDSSKYYVANYLGHTISVMNGPVARTHPASNGLKGAGVYAIGEKIKDINLLEGYNPVTGCGAGCVDGLIGGFPVQTPVSPDGKFVITGNTLGGNITIVDTATDTIVRIIPCDPGCHGVNFGAKAGGGYYAYVTPKFSNRLIVVDYDKNNDGILDPVADPKEHIAGWVILANNGVSNDDAISGNYGQGAQGVMPIPNVYNGWVQKLPADWCGQLTVSQRSPFPGTPITPCTP